MLELNKIYNQDCLEGLKMLDEASVDLTVTSPPYDNLRTYQDDDFKWDFDTFKPIAQELYRVTKPGGIVVWIIGDAVNNGGETGSSFRQALYFQELGFKIHDTMIYEKNGSSFPAKATSKRYSQIFEYMFVFVKGKIRNDIKLIADKRNKWAGWTNWGTHTQYDKEGNLVKTNNNKPTPEFSLRNNIWRYTVSFNDKTSHPAVFPERLAEDHILSWTVPGDTVLDPFMGSGTTAKMAMLNGRNFIGFEKSSDYYQESLKRIGKYVGKTNETLFTTGVTVDGGVEEMQVNRSEDDKELDGKMVLWDKIITELNQYFNEQKLEILRSLKLTFASKSNDEKVKKILTERGLITEETPETVVSETEVTTPEPVVEPASDEKHVEPQNSEINVDVDKLFTLLMPKISEYLDNRVTVLVQKLAQPHRETYSKPETVVSEKPEAKKHKYTYSNGTKVRITEGEFEGMTGVIEFSNKSLFDDETLYQIILDDSGTTECYAHQFKGVRGKREK